MASSETLHTSNTSDSHITQKKTGFFNKLIKKSKDLKGLPKTLTQSELKSISLASRRSSIKNGKRDSIYSKQFVDDDNSSLYNDDMDDSTSIIDDETDDSMFETVDNSDSPASFEKIVTGNNSTFDNHTLSEKVMFPASTEGLDMDIPIDQEPPYVGLTYESFLSPKYVKTTRRNKQSPRVVNNLFLAQELNVNETAVNSGDAEAETEDEHDGLLHDEDFGGDTRREIFVMEFSKDGKYLAAAGRDSVIRIWKVISSPLARMEFNQLEKENGQPLRSNKRDSVFDTAPVFHRQPVREFRGHSSSVLSLAWSKNNFLITGSMDKTVKLWHVDRDRCLQTFEHEDFVTSVKFHPLDDRFFLSGSLDNGVRLWSVLENSVSYSKNLGDEVLITALEFSPDGLHCFVGGFNGSLFILETKGLFEVFRVEIKERSIVHPFVNKNGNKITGIKVFDNDLYQGSGVPGQLDKWTVLVTTNDSKVRIITTTQKRLITRFRGLTNNSSSIVAHSSDDQKYIISGSEDHYCYIWENNNSIINNKLKQSLKEFMIDGKQHISDFHHKHEKYSKFVSLNKFLNKFLEEDKDRKYDFVANENNSYTCFHAHHSRCNVAIFAPESTKKHLLLSDDLIYDLKRRGESCRISPSSCFTCNSKNHKLEDTVQSGDIIVTTDQFGLIRVFRQDCAYAYRRMFIDFYRKGQIKNCNDIQLITQSEKTLPIRRALTRRDRSTSRIRAPSLSPVRQSENSKSIRNILASKINSSVPSTPSSETSFSSTIGSSSIDTRHYPGVAVLPKNPMLSISAAARNPLFMQPGVSVPIDHDNVVEADRTGSDTTLGAESGTQTPQPTLNQDDMQSSRTSTVPQIVFSKESESPDATNNNHHSQLEGVKINSQSQSRGRTKS